jgi:hypothetical protein
MANNALGQQKMGSGVRDTHRHRTCGDMSEQCVCLTSNVAVFAPVILVRVSISLYQFADAADMRDRRPFS